MKRFSLPVGLLSLALLGGCECDCGGVIAPIPDTAAQVTDVPATIPAGEHSIVVKQKQPSCRFRVKVNGGVYDGFEGELESMDESHKTATVWLNVYGKTYRVEVASDGLEFFHAAGVPLSLDDITTPPSGKVVQCN